MTVNKHSFVFAALAALLSIGALNAQQCSTKSTVGKYLVICDGYLTPGPNAPLVPAKFLGTANIDQEGQIKGSTTAMIGGQLVSQVVTGKEKINSDCSGTVTYAQKLNGQDGPPLNITFYVSDFGSRIDGIGTDAGSVLSCVLRRTSFSLFSSADFTGSSKETPPLVSANVPVRIPKP